MKKVTILALLLFLPLQAHALDKWTTTDIVGQAAFTAVTVLDWSQTLDIANHPGLHETNPILGKHPSRGEINTYFPLVILGHAAVTALIPESCGLWGIKCRTAWQSVWIGIEAGTVISNYNMGLKINF